MQKRVIPLFHYALNPGGFLALGISESIGTFSDLFTQVDKKQRIFAKRVTAVRPVFEFPQLIRTAEPTEAAGSGTHVDGPLLKGVDVYHEADRMVLNHYAPAGVLINEQMDILQFRGDTSHFLRPAPGRASLNLLQMAREGLLTDLRSAITQAQKTGSIVNREGVQLRFEGTSLRVTVHVIPLVLPPPLTPHYVILFEEDTSPTSRKVRPRARPRETVRQEAERERNNQLALEFEATKHYLQSIIERYEVANEELKSANEEVLSSNEELQSTNEELETAKEELQSTNEELSTVNDEIRQRNQDLAEANNDLTNLFSSANLPIILLDSDLCIRRFTASAAKVLNVIPTDIGRPVGHLNLNIPIPDLESLILESIDSVSIREREVQDREGHWYCLRIRPYRTTDNKIDGAMLLILDRQLRMIQANPAYYQVFQTSPEETEQQFIYDLGNGQWNSPELRILLDDVIPHDSQFHTQFHNFTVTHEFPRIAEKTVVVNARRIKRDGQEMDSILLGIEDITQYRQAEERIAAALGEKRSLAAGSLPPGQEQPASRL